MRDRGYQNLGFVGIHEIIACGRAKARPSSAKVLQPVRDD